MSLSSNPPLDRRRFLGLFAGAAALVLAGCGFTPVYGPGSAATNLRGRIALPAFDSRLSFDMFQRLEQRLGPPQAPLFRLTVSTTIEEQGLAISQDNAITRYNLRATAEYSLTRLTTDERVFAARARAFTAYSATASAYATRVAARDAERRIGVLLADQIASRIAVEAADLMIADLVPPDARQ